MKERIKGRVWKFGKNVDTDQIIPAEYLVTGNVKELAKHAFEKVRPEFPKNVKKGDIIVADENFGCGSSREHAPRALIGAGISAVIAKSFARIFFRNSINIGLPVIECTVEADEFDIIDIDFVNGRIINTKTGKEFKFKSLPSFFLNLIESGGLVPYVKNQLKGR
ncbi:MAG TPA: 3-isopropylmalate dehydratase small subunit [Candidatus Altiarchaeales archaeon]|nr:3-isopropylmalate dehydratase small subunit [Candidatus Altiarchaeales archaeon]